MTLNYKIITEVLKLNERGFNDLDIASQLGFDAQELIEHDVSTLEAIEDCLEEETTNAAEIAKKLNLPINYITGLACDYGLKEVKINKDDRIRFLRRRRGIMLRGKQEQKNLKKRRRSKKNLEQKAEEVSVNAEIDALVMQGADFSVIESASGLESKEVTTYLKVTNQYKLWLSQFKERINKEPSLRKKQQRTKTGKIGRTKTKAKRIPEVDKLIKKVATLDEMKKAAGWTSCVSARHYMTRTNQYKKWKADRGKPKLEEQQRKAFIGNATKIAQQNLYNKSDRIEQKIFEFLTNTPKSKITYDTLKTIYTRYFEAKDKRKKLSLVELSKGTGLWNSKTGKILNKVGLEPLHGKKERHITPQWKKEAIKRAFNLDVNPPDIAYFLDLPEHIIYQNMKMIGPRPKRQEFITKPLANTGLPDLTYRLASQIYEARDLKFEIQEIVELLDTKKIIVNYMLKNETIISPKIFDMLKTLYPEKNITTPYIPTKQNN